ncbi:putative CoA-substrate-specific enzyme activase [Natranaerovirga hydrolytica]|uniref:Putative CoA-substrate-specific enzyme activase n=1 Tax=Natranaerovirga hydrolytica TaxID=680378 RepID=A0A4R1MZ27_9FIRM|nr:acyl-CoA dehydratase activase [Natranaerovirga hydrolytica]TCK98578.1 putative CoA-substrate-specific enzyme activase [Natranaerovirga hydrolytica]
MKSIGICVGASSVSYVIANKELDNIHITKHQSLHHEGHPLNVLNNLFETINFSDIDKIAVTGRKFKSLVNASILSEPEAVEYALSFEKDLYKNVNLVLSAGGETFMVYEVDANGRIIDVFTGNKCASGTGEFFLQQIKRMGLSLDEAMDSESDKCYKVAGRCSVFCKSDCTHALNKGTPKEDVINGLCEMMSKKLYELTKKSDSSVGLIIGGTSKNKKLVQQLSSKMDQLYTSDYSYCYEALGTALWALENETKPITSLDNFINKKHSSFSFFSKLDAYEDYVEFKEINHTHANENDVCILGLDVGSTTTKAVLIKKEDHSIVASCYLRTNGDPIQASRNCYTELNKQLNHTPIKIVGLGVTGSGRQIAGLHALTPSVMNEIIAHASASIYFDPEVDTIFEIGGQDAKYTYITNGVPSDYAMNEACSAGTGSFLEEAAKETLDIEMTEIQDYALRSINPPNFSDQCSAFISSDIKSAIQEGIPIEDITAGLVYSVCMNYNNRVKGSRPIGKKIFMQGGVCYNKAVPIAMAAMTNKKIIVPPNPGLMGAFGAALEVKNKLDLNLIESMDFNLDELSTRNVHYKEPFICSGGKEKCDRKCSINRIVIGEETFPFGGACNLYEQSTQINNKKNYPITNYVDYRENLVYKKYGVDYQKRINAPQNKTIGILNSLLTNSLYPMYHNFFYALGYDIFIPKNIDEDGIEQKSAAFCYPVELSHGLFSSLLKEESVDTIFLPHVKTYPIKNSDDVNVTCPFVQGEPYYLQSAFKDVTNKKIISPFINFDNDFNNQRNTFIEIGVSLGHPKGIVEQAFDMALQAQLGFVNECQAVGKVFLKELENNPTETAIVLFGRPYNAFSKIGNMGIPHKFATRNYRIIPHDFLPYHQEYSIENMYWAMGQQILKSARFVEKHPQLFGSFITNFSCGPDSFVLGYFRNIMGKKPSLTLELDSHTADAGIDTRIEAFLDIIKSYNQLKEQPLLKAQEKYTPAKTTVEKDKLYVIDSHNKKYPLNHPKVHVLIPSMGDLGSKLLAATFRYAGINASVVTTPTDKELQLGRSYSSCKECMPLILTIGSLMHYLDNRKNEDELLVYFMPNTSGPCRFGQYSILMKEVIEKRAIKDVALFSLTSENSYAGLGTKFVLRAWQCIVISDVLDDIYSAVLALSKDPIKGLYVYHKICEKIIASVENDSWKDLKVVLEESAQSLQTIQQKQSIEKAIKVGLVGEIYVRRDQFSRQKLVERLAQKDIIVKVSPFSEWIYYCDYMVKNKLGSKGTFKDQFRASLQGYFKVNFEKAIKKIFDTTNFYEYHLLDVEKIIDHAKDLISPKLTGEAILTTGAAITEIIDEVDGIISIGPFGCMPSRIAEALINDNLDQVKKEKNKDNLLVNYIQSQFPKLPFLPIEVDGNVLPQVTEAKLESFSLQVKRVQDKINAFNEEAKENQSAIR